VDDAKLLDRACRGDEAAFSQLYARHQRAIFLYAARMCGVDAGDDVVQETFLALLRQGGRYDAARGSLGAYLFGIARHVVMKQLERRYGPIDPNPPGDDIAAEQETPLEALSRIEHVEALRAAVDALPPLYREAIVLCELQEFDYATAAAIMQCPIGTVRSRLHRARAQLTARLKCRALSIVTA
jgi:RNA polymerase sigma-70 factor (ECF subfamily)